LREASGGIEVHDRVGDIVRAMDVGDGAYSLPTPPP
jgi:hypothetical protein